MNQFATSIENQKIWCTDIYFLREHFKKLGFEDSKPKSIFPTINDVPFGVFAPYPNAFLAIEYDEYKKMPHCLRKDGKKYCFIGYGDKTFDILSSRREENDLEIYCSDYFEFLTYNRKQIEEIIEKFKKAREILKSPPLLS